MDFGPENTVVKLCMQGMALEEKHQLAEATGYFLQAWKEANNEFEQFIASWYLARCETELFQKLRWYKTALELAVKVNNEAVKSAFSSLYLNLANCYEQMGNLEEAERYQKLALTSINRPSDKGPFYHGTRADLNVGDQLTPGWVSNYQTELVMNHIYFTALVNGAGLAAALANGEGNERIYVVKPTGSFEDDPNVTNKKFPGNPTRSYRTQQPLIITGEVTEWLKQTPEQIQQWREKLAENKGKIIN